MTEWLYKFTAGLITAAEDSLSWQYCLVAAISEKALGLRFVACFDLMIRSSSIDANAAHLAGSGAHASTGLDTSTSHRVVSHE
jgi:hypothetical protein